MKRCGTEIFSCHMVVSAFFLYGYYCCNKRKDLHYRSVKNDMKKYFSSLSIFFLFFLLTITVTYPLIFHLDNYIFGLDDELLITWIINWNMYAFVHQPFAIFQAASYYPYANALAYSDAFFTTALFAFIPVIGSGEPLVAYTFSYIFSLTTFGFFTYLLIKHLTKEQLGAIVGGVLVAYSTYTLGKFMHLQVISVQWVPLSILFFIQFLEKQKKKKLILCAVTFLLQVYNSFLPGYFLVFSYIVLLWYFWKYRHYPLHHLRKKSIYMTIIVIIFCVIPIVLPYYQVSREFHYVRDIRDTVHFANRPEYLFFAGPATRLGPFFASVFYRNDPGKFQHEGYLGGTLLLLSVAAINKRKE